MKTLEEGKRKENAGLPGSHEDEGSSPSRSTTTIHTINNLRQ